MLKHQNSRAAKTPRPITACPPGSINLFPFTFGGRRAMGLDFVRPHKKGSSIIVSTRAGARHYRIGFHIADEFHSSGKLNYLTWRLFRWAFSGFFPFLIPTRWTLVPLPLSLTWFRTLTVRGNFFRILWNFISRLFSRRNYDRIVSDKVIPRESFMQVGL